MEWTVELFGMLCLGNFARVFLGGWSFGGWLRRVTSLRRKHTRMILMRRPRSDDWHGAKSTNTRVALNGSISFRQRAIFGGPLGIPRN